MWSLRKKKVVTSKPSDEELRSSIKAKTSSIAIKSKSVFKNKPKDCKNNPEDCIEWEAKYGSDIFVPTPRVPDTNIKVEDVTPDEFIKFMNKRRDNV